MISETSPGYIQEVLDWLVRFLSCARLEYKVHQTFRPTHSGVEDNALWNEDRSAYGWFVCVLASGQRPAPDDSKQEQLSS
jgi:hypothetical protein